ncbi:MAG: hypothetical protein CM15mP122_4680 [Bacteroidota bacterium]|nr:MAG: hypothetical protein CM15mP122_4680 [Bacteroidota bacterium]
MSGIFSKQLLLKIKETITKKASNFISKQKRIRPNIRMLICGYSPAMCTM